MRGEDRLAAERPHPIYEPRDAGGCGFRVVDRGGPGLRMPSAEGHAAVDATGTFQWLKLDLELAKDCAAGLQRNGPE